MAKASGLHLNSHRSSNPNSLYEMNRRFRHRRVRKRPFEVGIGFRITRQTFTQSVARTLRIQHATHAGTSVPSTRTATLTVAADCFGFNSILCTGTFQKQGSASITRRVAVGKKIESSQGRLQPAKTIEADRGAGFHPASGHEKRTLIFDARQVEACLLPERQAPCRLGSSERTVNGWTCHTSS